MNNQLCTRCGRIHDNFVVYVDINPPLDFDTESDTDTDIDD